MFKLYFEFCKQTQKIDTPLTYLIMSKKMFLKKNFFVTFSDIAGTLPSGTLSFSTLDSYMTQRIPYPLIPLGVRLKPYSNPWTTAWFMSNLTHTHNFLKGKTLGCPWVTLLKGRKSPPYSQNIWTLLWHSRMFVCCQSKTFYNFQGFFYKISTFKFQLFRTVRNCGLDKHKHHGLEFCHKYVNC